MACDGAGDHAGLGAAENLIFSGLLREPFFLGASMGWWFGRKSAPADARPFVPAWLQMIQPRRGLLAPIPSTVRGGLQAQSGRPAVGAAGRRDAWRLTVDGAFDRLRTGRGRAGPGATGCSRASPRTCCCTAMPMCSCCRRRGAAGGIVPAAAGAGERGGRRGAAGRRPISTRPAGSATRIEREGRAGAAAARAHEGAASARRPLWHGLPRRGDAAASVHNARGAVEQGAARQCGAAVAAR